MNYVLSIDIGIRNLSLCIMNALDKTDINTYQIHLWDVFNTLDSDDYKCESLQKNGKVCGKKCGFKYTKLQNVTHCCKTHFPKDINITKDNMFKKKNIDMYLLQDIAKIVLQKIQNIYDTNILLFDKLNDIIIELQPSISPRNKFISHIVYGKLVELLRNQNTKIKFIRASSKLKAYTGPDIECKLKGAYAKRKWLSVQYCKWFLEHKFLKEQKDKWMPIFLSHTKLDDMSDCFLYCINAIRGLAPKQKFNKGKKCIK
jgi:hypothetical protein